MNPSIDGPMEMIKNGSPTKTSRLKDAGFTYFGILNTILTLGVLTCTILILFKFKHVETVPKDSVSEEIFDSVVQAHFVDVDDDTGSLKDYLSVMTSRDFFAEPWTQNVVQPRDVPVPTVPLQQKMKLMGIVLGESPQAIVQSLSTKTTFFVSPGDSVEGAVLKNVSVNSSVWEYSGQDVTLTVQ